MTYTASHNYADIHLSELHKVEVCFCHEGVRAKFCCALAAHAKL